MNNQTSKKYTEQPVSNQIDQEIKIVHNRPDLNGPRFETLKKQTENAFDNAYILGLDFALDPEGCGYSGMERIANFDLPELENCRELAELVFTILCGEGSDGPLYNSSDEFWRNQFAKERQLMWIPTSMEILGFCAGVGVYWEEEGMGLALA